ncbi:hypothetical protein K435DRAFT_860716, partial [Dendrothele bispora CBS 962.96]
MAPKLSPVWEHIHKGPNKYKNNKYHNQSWCKYCIAQAVQLRVNGYNERASAGEIREVPTFSEVSTEVHETLERSGDAEAVDFGSSVKVQTLQGQPEKLWKHLRNCVNAPLNVQQVAGADLDSRKKGSSSHSQGTVNTFVSPTPSVVPSPGIFTHAPLPNAAATPPDHPALRMPIPQYPNTSGF